MKYRYFDSAATTPCLPEAAQRVQTLATELFGNPSSAHLYGQQAARAIREARLFFAHRFNVEPEQVVFTGSGSEANNLTIYGIAGATLETSLKNPTHRPVHQPRVLISATEHPSVQKTAESLASLGFDTRKIPVDHMGQVVRDEFLSLLSPETLLVSIQQVNNITGARLPVESLARLTKDTQPSTLFHCDAIQGLGKTELLSAPSAIDLVSISGHKVGGPKGVGALILLNQRLLKSGLRPLIWGGAQEGGFRAGTQNAGLISGFHFAAEKSLTQQDSSTHRIQALRDLFRELLIAKKLLTPGTGRSQIIWNSPDTAVPHIVSLSIPPHAPGPLTRLLEERGFLVSTGSACSSRQKDPEPVLLAMGVSQEISRSAIRISFSESLERQDVQDLVDALDDSIQRMKLLSGRR